MNEQELPVWKRIENKILEINDGRNRQSVTYEKLGKILNCDSTYVLRYVKLNVHEKPWLALVSGPRTPNSRLYQSYEEYLAVRPSDPSFNPDATSVSSQNTGSGSGIASRSEDRPSAFSGKVARLADVVPAGYYRAGNPRPRKQEADLMTLVSLPPHERSEEVASLLGQADELIRKALALSFGVLDAETTNKLSTLPTLLSGVQKELKSRY